MLIIFFPKKKFCLIVEFCQWWTSSNLLRLGVLGFKFTFKISDCLGGKLKKWCWADLYFSKQLLDNLKTLNENSSANSSDDEDRALKINKLSKKKRPQTGIVKEEKERSLTEMVKIKTEVQIKPEKTEVKREKDEGKRSNKLSKKSYRSSDPKLGGHVSSHWHTIHTY